MLRLLVVLALYMCVFLLEVPPLLQRRAWRELFAFAVLCLLGLALGIPWALHRKVIFPSEELIKFFEPLAQAILGPPE
ncbi:hypothetical protein SAMN00808754_0611 [Thermanaeromonas toyohensis ToBE]|uniref:Uncharacterized protein n=1 Tax=Thermanaeromonas toyohensis ToBE TaxID=698762 RepID=A0A1W1VGE1_9FIRM|nr:hypothetical protein SAMN00808754_0611 [Thermanaeromonas toyohensis ToBE]